MKKQLLTGALALSVLMGSTGMAFAADMPAVEFTKSVSTSEKGDIIADTTADQFKISDQKAYTADSYATEIEETKADLDTMVKSNDMSREDADKILDRMEQDLQKIKDGSLTLYYYDMLDEDGTVVGKISMAAEVTDANSIAEDSDAVQMDTFSIKLTEGDTTNAVPLKKIVPVNTQN